MLSPPSKGNPVLGATLAMFRPPAIGRLRFEPGKLSANRTTLYVGDSGPPSPALENPRCGIFAGEIAGLLAATIFDFCLPFFNQIG